MSSSPEKKQGLTFAAAVEAATGLALLLVPALVGQLLLGEQPTGVAIPVARVAGILTYGALVTIFLAYLGLEGMSGILLWPAVVFHLILTGLLVRASTKHSGA